MKRIDQINATFIKLTDRTIKRVAEAQQEARQKICEDIKAGANVDTGAYRDSIKVAGTVIDGTQVYTDIYSRLTLGGDNPTWQNVPLARIIENGTIPHFIEPRNPNGVLRWEDENGVHYAKWVFHPGTTANPHWSTALLKNRRYYRNMIRKAVLKSLWKT